MVPRIFENTSKRIARAAHIFFDSGLLEVQLKYPGGGIAGNRELNEDFNRCVTEIKKTAMEVCTEEFEVECNRADYDGNLSLFTLSFRKKKK